MITEASMYGTRKGGADVTFRYHSGLSLPVEASAGIAWASVPAIMAGAAEAN